LPPVERRCGICDLGFGADGPRCGNPICQMDADDRAFGWNLAIAMRTGHLKAAITDYKYGGRRAWAVVFGRILIGFLDANEDFLRHDVGVDLIVGSPAFIGEDAERDWDHIRAILVAADGEQWFGEWPIDLTEPAAIIKTAATGRMVGRSAPERAAHARDVLRPALSIPDPERTRGRTILVFDDVLTGGWTLRAVARALRYRGGARAVYGITLARQPFEPR
jgi:predicted amidophosphoribosyltransferase